MLWPWGTSLPRLVASGILHQEFGKGSTGRFWLAISGLWTGRVGDCPGLPRGLSCCPGLPANVPAQPGGSLVSVMTSWGSHRVSLRLWPQAHRMPPGGVRCRGTFRRPVPHGQPHGRCPHGARCRAEALGSIVLQAGWAQIPPPWTLSPRQCVRLCLLGRQIWEDLHQEKLSCR